MKKNTLHYHLTIKGKNILCAVDYENQLEEYDVTIWCDNRLIGREKMKSINRQDLNRIIKDKFFHFPKKIIKNLPVAYK